MFYQMKTTRNFESYALRRILLVLTLQVLCKVVSVQSATCSTQPCLYFGNGQSLQAIEINSSMTYSVVPNLRNVVAVDVHVRKNLVFWSETRPNAIKMFNITDGKVETILSPGNLGEVEGLAVEWESGMLYWTDFTNRRIEVARLDGKNRKILIAKGVRNPRGISVDPRTGYMFWTSWGLGTRIERASLSGHNKTTLVNLFTSWQFLPNGLTIDFNENRIYWADALFTQMESMDFDGNNRQHFTALPFDIHPYDIVLHAGVFYLSNWSSSNIERIDKATTVRLGSYTGLEDGSILGLAMFSGSNQPPGSTACHSDSLCSHLCLLSPVGYECTCPTGTRLNADRRTCDTKGLTKFLLIVDESHETLYQFPLDTKFPLAEELPLALDDVKDPIAVDFDPIENRVYWADDDRGTIFRAFLNGSSQEEIVQSLSQLESIALDLTGRNLYWTDSALNRIEVSKMDGSFRRTIVYRDLDEPGEIVLHEERGHMYWTQRRAGIFPRIERSDMDGANRLIVNHWSSFVLPKALTLDKEQNRLYFSDDVRRSINFITLGNNVITTILSRLSTPTGLAVHENFVYWTEKLGRGGSVYRADKISGKNVERIVSGLQTPEDIVVYDVGNGTDQSVKSACQSNNGGCSHLCLLTSGGYQCACPNEMTLKDDMKTCHFREFLLFADSGIRRIFKIDLNNPQTPMVALNLQAMRSPTALDFDPQEDLIYWSDVKFDQISRSHPNGTSFEVVVSSGLKKPRGLAVDFTGRNLYWTDFSANKIEVSKLDGSYRKVLFSQSVLQPMDIILDMENGIMFWSSWGSQPKIERAHMDGSNRSTVVNLANLAHALGILPQPSGLALDPRTQRLYWVDSGLVSIQYIDVRLGGGTVVTLNIASGHLWKPYGLSLQEDRIFWSDIGSNNIYSADKNTGGNVKNLANNLMNPRDVYSYHNYTALPDSHPCALANGWCTHLCLLVPGGYRCACPNTVLSGAPCQTLPVLQLQSTIAYSLPTTKLSSSPASHLVSTLLSTSLLTSLLPSLSTFSPSSSPASASNAESTLPLNSPLQFSSSALPSPATFPPSSFPASASNAVSTSPFTSSLKLSSSVLPSLPSLSTFSPSLPLSIQFSSSQTSLSPSPLNPSLSSSFSSPFVHIPMSSFTVSLPFTMSLSPTLTPGLPPLTSASVLPSHITQGAKSKSFSLHLPAQDASVSTPHETPSVFILTSISQPASKPLTSILTTSSTEATSHPVTDNFPHISPSLFSKSGRLTSSSKHYSSRVAVITLTAERSLLSSSLSILDRPPSRRLVVEEDTAPHAGTSSMASSSAAPTPAPDDPCVPNPCKNAGDCARRTQGKFKCQCPVNYASSLCDLYIGNDSVRITFNMTFDQWQVMVFQESISKAFTEFCSQSTCDFQKSTKKAFLSRRRSVTTGAFKSSDVIVVNYAEYDRNFLDVVAAVLVPASNQQLKRETIPALTLCKMVRESSTEISKNMGDVNIVMINRDEEPSCGVSSEQRVETIRKPGSAAQGREPLSQSKLAGVVTGTFILLVIIMIAAVYCRFRRRSMPWKRASESKMTPCFNNPGFIPDVQDPVVLDVDEFPLGNPDYEEVTTVVPPISRRYEEGTALRECEGQHYAEVGPPASLSLTKGASNRINVNSRLPKTKEHGKLKNRRVQSVGCPAQRVYNSLSQLENQNSHQRNKAVMTNPIYDTIEPLRRERSHLEARNVHKRQYPRQDGRLSCSSRESDDSGYSSLIDGGSIHDTSRATSNSGYAKPLTTAVRGNLPGTSEYAPLGRRGARRPNGHVSNEYAKLDQGTMFQSGRKRNLDPSNTSSSQVQTNGKELKHSKRKSATPGAKQHSHINLPADLRPSDGGQRRSPYREQQHSANRNCIYGSPPVLVLEKDGDTDVDETII